MRKFFAVIGSALFIAGCSQSILPRTFVGKGSYKEAASCFLAVLEETYPNQVRYEEISGRRQIRLFQDVRDGYISIRTFTVIVDQADQGYTVDINGFNDRWHTKISGLLASCVH